MRGQAGLQLESIAEDQLVVFHAKDFSDDISHLLTEDFVDSNGVTVSAKTNYIHPLPHLSDNLKFAFDMKYRSLSLCDLLAPILHATTVALGGAIPVHTLFSVEEGNTV